MIMLSSSTETALLSMSGVMTGFLAVHAALRTWKNFRAGNPNGKFSDVGTGIANIAVILLAVSYVISLAQHLHVDWRRLLLSAKDIVSENEFIFGLIGALVSAGINAALSYRRARASRKRADTARQS